MKSIKTNLINRSLLQLSGKDVQKFLNGICTQSIPKFEDGNKYASFLTPTGRVLFDSFIYPVKDNDQNLIYYLDVDKRFESSILNLCKKYLLRSKVRIKLLDQSSYQVWYSNQLPCQSSDVLYQSSDPRLPQLGYRILKHVNDQSDLPNDEESYRRIRYQLGIPEGVEDLWPEKSLPLESNVDYMNGVNFRKGCYVGQELTIRTHHTGVVRKRILPMTLEPDNQNSIQQLPSPQTNIYIQLPNINQPKQVGKFCSGMLEDSSNLNKYIGLGLFRLEQIKKAPNDIFINDTNTGLRWNVKPIIPDWWPYDAKTEAQLKD